MCCATEPPRRPAPPSRLRRPVLLPQRALQRLPASRTRCGSPARCLLQPRRQRLVALLVAERRRARLSLRRTAGHVVRGGGSAGGALHGLIGGPHTAVGRVEAQGVLVQLPGGCVLSLPCLESRPSLSRPNREALGTQSGAEVFAGGGDVSAPLLEQRPRRPKLNRAWVGRPLPHAPLEDGAGGGDVVELRFHASPRVMQGCVGRFQFDAMGEGAAGQVDGALRLKVHPASLPQGAVAALALGGEGEKAGSVGGGATARLHARP
mmetsp:Transcript_17968/g.58784  ORF Transcript_17968/g.58784 Transcript_17968/m.58784 type:complete len:264 (-) Transcript_17968:888-1679(-)